MRKNRKMLVISGVIILISTLIMSLSIQNIAFGDPGSPMDLTATITTASDGVAPLPAIDSSTSNGEVGNLDLVTQNFDFTINPNDGRSHNLTHVIITATLTPAAGDANWSATSISNLCIGQYPGGQNVSPDGSTIKCRLNGPFIIGSVNQITASWSPTVATPNNTNVDVAFTIDGFMAPDSDFPTPINPDSATSSTVSINAVSEASSLEMRKNTRGLSNYRINRDGSGAPISVTIPWAVTLGIVNPNDGNAKGTNTTSLGDVTFDDDLSSLGAPFQNAVLGNCGIGVAGDDTATPIGVSAVSNPPGNRGAVKNAGTFSCVQAGGAGTMINVTNSGIDYDAEWFPFGYSNATPSEWFGFNSSTYPNEIWNTPAGQNNHAVISGGYIETIIPWNDISSLDQQPGDLSNAVGKIKFCDTVSNLEVVGEPGGYSEPTTDNSACIEVTTGVGISAGKRFTLGSSNNQAVDTIKGSSASNFGGSGGDNIVYPGEKLFSNMTYSNSDSSALGVYGVEMCDGFDTNNMSIVDSSFYTDLGSYNTFVGEGFDISTYSAKNVQTSIPTPGFPNFDSSDVYVEFGHHPNMTTSSELRNVNCSDSSIDWKTDPNDVVGGIGNVNVIHVYVTTGKPLPPGKAIQVSIPMQVKTSKVPGDVVQNVMTHKASSEITGGTTNTWATISPSCSLYDWNTASSGNLCDRALVIPAVAHLEITDNQDALVTGTTHNQAETTKQVTAGQNWQFDVRASMSYMSDLEVKGTVVYVVLPDGLYYDSSTLQPTSIINECDAATNFSCIANPANRTQIGSTTLVWELGDKTFEVPSGQSAGIPYYEEGFFGFWKVTAKTNRAFPSGVIRQTKAWMDTDSGFSEQTTAFPNTNSPWSYYFDNGSNGTYDDDWITFSNSAQFIISKSTPDVEIPLNGQGRFDISYSNANGGARTFDFIDVLPYNGDGRVPNSSFAGSYSLSNIDYSRAPGIAQTYITSEPSSTLDDDPFNNVPAGTGIWSCTYLQMDTTGCPTSQSVTGIRFITSSLAIRAFETVRVTIDTDDVAGRDIYTNRSSGRAQGLAGLIRTEDVSFTNSGLRLGNRVFDDRNNNGKYDGGDVPIAGVRINLFDAGPDGIRNTSDDIDKGVFDVTDSMGEYSLVVSQEGNYFVKIDSSDLGSGGVIEYYSAARFGVSTDNVDDDEATDHNAIAYSLTEIMSSVLHISNEQEPIGEVGDSDPLDNSSNYTLDLGLVRPVVLGNYVWEDKNQDGLQNVGERGIEGVQISATWYGPDGIKGTDDDEIFTTTSSNVGFWQIKGPAGKYEVNFKGPPGFRETTVNVGGRDADSDSNGVNGTLNGGDSDYTFDFGFISNDDPPLGSNVNSANGSLSNTGFNTLFTLLNSLIMIVVGLMILGFVWIRRKRQNIL